MTAGSSAVISENDDGEMKRTEKVQIEMVAMSNSVKDKADELLTQFMTLGIAPSVMRQMLEDKVCCAIYTPFDVFSRFMVTD